MRYTSKCDADRSGVKGNLQSYDENSIFLDDAESITLLPSQMHRYISDLIMVYTFAILRIAFPSCAHAFPNVNELQQQQLLVGQSAHWWTVVFSVDWKIKHCQYICIDALNSPNLDLFWMSLILATQWISKWITVENKNTNTISTPFHYEWTKIMNKNACSDAVKSIRCDCNELTVWKINESMTVGCDKSQLQWLSSSWRPINELVAGEAAKNTCTHQLTTPNAYLILTANYFDADTNRPTE